MGALAPRARAATARRSPDARRASPRARCAPRAAQVLITLLVTAVVLPLCIWDFARHKHERAYVGAPHSHPSAFQALASKAAPLRAVWFIAGLFVLLAIPVSAYGVQAHMEHYCAPKLQKHVVRILWMPCVYGLDAWLALRFKARCLLVLACCAAVRAVRLTRMAAQDHSIYFDTLRECYEAFVIYHFFTFIIVYLEQARCIAP